MKTCRTFNQTKPAEAFLKDDRAAIAKAEGRA